MTTITNAAGREINFCAAFELMDRDIIADLGGCSSPFADLGYWDTLNAQQQFDEYSARHLVKFSVAFEPNTANPLV